MTSWSDLLADPPPQQHLVQFYGDAEDLVRNVRGYLGAGARRGESLLVIATPPHVAAFTRALAEDGLDPARLLRDGQLVVDDAAAVLDRILDDHLPLWTRFSDIVGGYLRRMRARADGTGLRVYGEMVDLLWASGRLSAAARLEEFWNRLMRTHAFGLYCAYGADLLSETLPAGGLHAVMRAHSHVLPGRGGPQLDQAVDLALEEVLGPAVAAALRPLIRENQHPRALLSRPDATLLWLRNNLHAHAGRVLARAHLHYHALCAAETV